MIVPSIDLYNGKAVQLRQGKEPVIERDDVIELLDQFKLFGEIAVVDLNAAWGKGNNRDLIKAMAKRAAIRLGGGIRDLETAQDYLKSGVKKIIIGTAAREPFLEKLPKRQIVIALDTRGEHWVTEGWRTSTPHKPEELLTTLSHRCSEFLYTQVDKEGMLGGIDRKKFETMAKLSPIPITFAGGVSSLEDIRFIRDLGAKAQIGMAVYSGLLNLNDCFTAQLDFQNHNLIPTIVQDAKTGNVLMLAYSSKSSLRMALEQKKGIYFSRSRNEIWEKGRTSGNSQKLLSVEADCDGDTILFQVEQKGIACHFNRYSCFPKTVPEFELETLVTTLKSRKENQSESSYTARLLKDPDLLAAKIKEEAQELIEAETFEEVRWESSDLIYFTLVKAISKGVLLEDIISELGVRHVNPEN